MIKTIFGYVRRLLDQYELPRLLHGWGRGRRTVATRLQALTKGYYFERRDAAEVLGRSGDVRFAKPLVKALADQNQDVRVKVVEALVTLGGAHTRNLLLADLKCKQGYVRASIVQVLGQLGEVRAVEPLLQCLTDAEADVRGNAAEALGRLGDARAVEPLINLTVDEDGGVRASVSKALGQLGDSRAVEPLIKLLVDEYEGVRADVVKALGQLGDSRAVEPLIPLLTDKQERVRDNAAEALGQLGDARAVEPLIALRIHGWRQVRALGQLGDVRAVEVLITALTSGSLHHRAEVAEALGRLGDVRAVEPLITLLTGQDCEMRSVAAAALAELGQPEWSQWVKGDQDDFLRLGASGNPGAVDPLIKAALAGEGHSHYCKDAARALGVCGDVRAVEPLITLLTRQDYEMRSVAAAALAELGQPEWSQWVKGDQDDFLRLGASGNPGAVDPLIKAALAGGGHSHYCKDAARALGVCGDVRAVEPLITLLTGQDYETRSVAAEAFVERQLKLPADDN